MNKTESICRKNPPSSLQDVLDSLKFFDRNELLTINKELQYLLSVKVSDIVSAIPAEIWKIIIGHSAKAIWFTLVAHPGIKHDLYLKQLELMFRKFGCVCRSWYSFVPEKVRSHFGMTRLDYSNWTLSHFTDLSSLSLSPTSAVTDKGLKKMTKLTSLYLYSSRLTPEGISDLTNLSTLLIHSDSKDQIEPITFTRLTNLTSLTLQSFELFSEPSFAYLPNLTSLDLRKGCGPIDPNKAPFLSNLTTLSICEKIGDDFVLNLPNLKNLILSNSSSVSITPSALSKLTNLKCLKMVRVIDSFSEALGNFTQLESLAISSRCCTDKNMRKLTNLTFLKLTQRIDRPLTFTCLFQLPLLNWLVLSDSGAISDRDLAKLSNLTRLELFKEVFITGEEGLSKLTFLKHLTLSRNNFIPGKSFQNLVNLTSLEIEACNVDDKVLMTLTRLTNLSVCSCSKITIPTLKALQDQARDIKKPLTITYEGKIL